MRVVFGRLVLLSLLSVLTSQAQAFAQLQRSDDDEFGILVPTLALPTVDEVEIEGFNFNEDLADQIGDEHHFDEAGIQHATTQLPARTAEDANEIKFNSSDVEPLMLYSTGVAIKGFWMKTRKEFEIVGFNIRPPKTEPPSITQALSVFFDIISSTSGQPSVGSRKSEDTLAVKTLNTIVGIDMDPNNKEVFWVELGKEPGIFSTVIEEEHFEKKHRREYLGYTTIVDSGLHSPEDLALDVVGKNLYVTDAGLPAIVVCSVRHGQCKILKDNHIHKPRAIIADSATGWLTYTDWGDKPGIYLVSMDGSKSETLIDTDVVWPNGLAADYQTDHLYWADARLSKIERVNLKTKKRELLTRDEAGNPFSLSLFEQRVYWSDWSGNDVKSCDKISGNNTKVLKHTDNLYGIHIYHPTIHKSVDQLNNPCWSKRCSHLCLLAPTFSTYTNREPGSILGKCACPEAMALGIDASTCFDRHLSFLLFSAKNFIAQVFPERIGLDTIERLIYSKSHSINDVASDWLHYRMFFYDAIKRIIYSTDLSESHHIKVSPMVVTTTREISGLTYDPYSDNLFWLDTARGYLLQAPVTGKFEVTIRKDLIGPTTMVLDRINRAFYIAYKGRIDKIDMAGSSRNDVTLVSSQIINPVALYLDEQKWRLYWADSDSETIESIAVDSSRAHDRIVHRQGLKRITAFSVYQDHFVWSAANSEYLHKVKISATREEKEVVMKLPHNLNNASEPHRIIMINPIHEAVGSPCHTKGCSHGCNLDQNHTPTCLCPPQMLLVNKTTCNKPAQKSPPQNSVKTDSAKQKVTLVVINSQVKSSTLQPPSGIELTTTSSQSTPSSIDHELPPKFELHSDEAEHHHIHDDVQIKEQKEGNHMIWLIVLLLLLSIAGLITLAGLILYKQGRLPSQVSQLTVSFMPQDKDGAMLLVDEDA